MNARVDRYRAPRRARGFDRDTLLEFTDSSSIDELWNWLAARIYAVPVHPVSEMQYERACPHDRERIFRATADALAHRVNLLGSGPVELGAPIDWHTDFKTGKSWPAAFMRDINYSNLGCPSDVKVPWEVSRLQWWIPVGQTYLLTRDERCAAATRAIFEEWIARNPYAHGVNWACTMEVAMRILTWTWFFHVFCRSRAWADETFRLQFLRALFLHGDFTERYLERSDINGNHFTADATALVVVGQFFGDGAAPERWAEEGWRLLSEELPRQVLPDGVDFEASVAYHRLVLELFFFAARCREAHGLPVPEAYRRRVIDMARFAAAYTRADGGTPLVGDADDARVLPFGGQAIGDHRYLAGLIGAHWNVPDLIDAFSGPRTEIFWALGPAAAASLGRGGQTPRRSVAFPSGGFYVMRNDCDHVFIDCGPVGQAGRGGHGHNDCLSFEAVLDGAHLVSDCGTYVYTASAQERNLFRSTAYHNTPQIDGSQINRFTRWDDLWTLQNDAIPVVNRWDAGSDCDIFVGSHTGYQRLDDPITPVRTIVLHHASHALEISDAIEGRGCHTVLVPLHLAPGVDARIVAPGDVLLRVGDREFSLTWTASGDWTFRTEAARISPSYGVFVPGVRLVWGYSGPLPVKLATRLVPIPAEASVVASHACAGEAV